MIGVDIGGTTIKSGVVDTEKGTVLAHQSVDTPNATSQEIAKLVASQARILLTSYPEIKSIGVGVPGSLNAERTLVQYPPNFPKWKEEPFPKYLRAELPEFDSVEIDNDANVATRAEATFGVGKGEKYFLLATLGTGVGGGIWSEGMIYRGAYGGAGEFGHISIAYNGEKCNCGATGCLEAYIGKEYLIRRALKKLDDKNVNSLLRQIPRNEIGVKYISEAANAGDEFAKGVLTEAGMMLGQAFASVAKLLDIRTFVVSGGIAEAGELIIAPARESLTANVFENQRNTVKLFESKLGIHSGIVGAALLGK
jgi:glucokinase